MQKVPGEFVGAVEQGTKVCGTQCQDINSGTDRLQSRAGGVLR